MLLVLVSQGSGGVELEPTTGFFYTVNKFFYISNTRLKLTKNQAKAKNLSEAELLLFENYPLSSSILSSKTNMCYLKNVQKTSVCVLMRLYY